MTDSEIAHLLRNVEMICNKAIDALIAVRQNGDKAKYRYITKKLEIIVGACNRGLDKMNNNV